MQLRACVRKRPRQFPIDASNAPGQGRCRLSRPPAQRLGIHGHVASRSVTDGPDRPRPRPGLVRQRACRSDTCNRSKRSCCRHRRSARIDTCGDYRSGRCNRRTHRLHTSRNSWGTGRRRTRRSAFPRGWDAPGRHARRAGSPHDRHVAQMRAHNPGRGCDGALLPGGAQLSPQ